MHGEHAYGGLSHHYIVTEEEKYCWFTNTGEEQYFDLKNDPQETKNCVHLLAYQDKVARMRSWLIKELENRPEGFVENQRLVAGKEYPHYIAQVNEA